MKIHIDGTNKSEIEKILYIKETETGSKLYIPVRAIAKYLNYEEADLFIHHHNRSFCIL